MIDYQKEELKRLKEIAKEVKWGYTTLLGYIKNGAVSKSGKRIYLEAVDTPKGLYTTKERFYDFIRRYSDESA